MREERRADGTILEIWEPTECAKCGQPWERRLWTYTFRNCLCPRPEHAGHRQRHCLRFIDGRVCHGITEDPPCRGQWGPTADYS